jgi:hypothetical protein
MPTETTGLNTEQVNKLKGMSGIDQNLLNTYKPSGPIQASVSADALTKPPKPVTVPEPTQATIPSNTLNVANNVARDTNGFIAAQTAEAAKLKELQATYGALGNEGSLSDLFKNTQAEYGVTPESFKELKDIQLQLTDMDTKSGLNMVTIESGGQGAIQGQRSLTQEDREAAVRSAGLASRAAVLQGNIQTATALARDAVNIAYQDRTLKAQNLLNQIEMVQGQVDDQTAQILEQEKRGYEAELAAIAEVKDAVANAMVNGATQSEMAQLTDPNIDDETKKALAQSIIARGANQMRGLEMEKMQSDISQGWESLNILREELALSKQRLDAELQASGNTYGTLDGKPQTATQALVNGYANRLIEAETVFDVVAEQFADPLAFGNVLPSVMQSGERQQYEQAKRNYVNAVLRRESGAVISPEEFKNAEMQYFPQAGDKPEVILQKEKNRNTVINNFYHEANVPRPVFSGDIIESDGKQYQVAEDGVTLIEL